MGINQLKPIAPRIPPDKCAVGLFRGPNSESITIVMAISVDVPSNKIPPKLELIIPCQSCEIDNKKHTILFTNMLSGEALLWHHVDRICNIMLLGN